MAKKIRFEDVRKLAMALPGVEDGTTRGSQALNIHGKLFAWIPVNKKDVEPNTLAIRIDFEQREALIGDAPHIYYITDHYLNYPAVLVRLDHMDRHALPDLIRSGWRFISAQTHRKPKKSKSPDSSRSGNTSASRR